MAAPRSRGQLEEVLMVVKTYPTPSKTYGELVCTAGIRLRDMKWIRIYPYPFRLLTDDHRFKKWSIMRMPLAKATDDPRPDSYNLVDAQAITKVRDVAINDKQWSDRMQYIVPTAVSTVAELQRMMLSEDRATWGPSILPVPVAAGSAIVTFKHVGDQWTNTEAAKLQKAKDQLDNNLFAPQEVREFFRVLSKLPYRTYISFEDLSGERYKLSVLDWEFGALWFNARSGSASDAEALEKIRFRIQDQMFAEKRTPYLVLGSMHHRFKKRSLLAIDCIIWPEKAKGAKPQPVPMDSLFGV